MAVLKPQITVKTVIRALSVQIQTCFIEQDDFFCLFSLQKC